MPKVSILTASYNYADVISQAIDSVLNQTYKNWELIIVDDGSKDNSLEIINNYVQKYDNIHLFTHPDNENKGLKETVKLGLEKCSGEYVAFLESDDFWEKDYLNKKVDIFTQNPDVKLIYNNVDLFGDEKLLKKYQNGVVKAINSINLNLKKSQDISYYFLLRNLVSTFSAAMVEKKALEECDFNSPVDIFLDWWLWLQITFKHRSYYMAEKLTNWRIHPASYINLKEKKKHENPNDFFPSFIKIAKKIDLEKLHQNLLNACIIKVLDDKINTINFNKESFVDAIKDKKVYLYGAGIFAENLLPYLKLLNLKIEGFFDGNKSKAGQKIQEYTIFHKDEIEKLKPDIIILSIKYWEPQYFELLTYLIEKNLNTMLIPGFFDELRFKSLLCSDNKKSPEELFYLINNSVR